MTTQIFHNRLGHIQLHKLPAADHPKTLLSLVSCQQARAFMGTVSILEFSSEDGNLFHNRYDFQPAVDLMMRDDYDGLKVLIMVEGNITLQSAATGKIALSEGKACVFRSREYQLGLPENTKAGYLLFGLEALARRMDWHDFQEGAFDLPYVMRKHRATILNPSGVGAFPRSWLSIQLSNLLFYTRKDINVAEPRYAVRRSLLDIALAVDDYIQHNLSRKLTVKEIARGVGTNEVYVKRAISDNFNMGCSERHMQLRLEQAKEILLQSDKTINEIAMECGWLDAGTFRRNFFDVNKINPSDWREKYKI